ncbi:MAG TPA: hypothetical protein VJV78_30900 [Polyangiales bacterium]|nr:hypothetical protein [Polyangiales bacterium]
MPPVPPAAGEPAAVEPADTIVEPATPLEGIPAAPDGVVAPAAPPEGFTGGVVAIMPAGPAGV